MISFYFTAEVLPVMLCSLGILQDMKAAARRAPVCLLQSGLLGEEADVSSSERISGVGTPDTPKWGREGKRSEPRSCRQCHGGAGILLAGQTQALELTGEIRVP